MAVRGPTLCWICGSPADSGEHIVKRSDLKSLVGTPTQADPIFFHTDKRRNRRVGSLDAQALKSPARICQYCNNTRTQPYDLAWQTLSEWLRFHEPVLQPGQFVRANSVFPYETRRSMRHLHLYFVKLFGLKIVEGSMAIDINRVADAILRDRLHPNAYLAFGPRPADEDPRVAAGGSNVEAMLLNGRVAFAVWIHHVGSLLVQVMFALDGEKRQGLVDAWNPRFGGQRLKIKAF